jgi:hypothetical protein
METLRSEARPVVDDPRTNRPSVGFFERFLPCALAFTASACIMTVELVAGRLIARHVGSSLYTWTSVIGIVLAGITVGNLAGGWLADRFEARRLVSALFIFGALACAVIPGVDYLVSKVDMITDMPSWPLRIATHVAIVFFPSSFVLGLIGPVVAKMALDQGRATGRTVGNVYAWGALGSIVGTFITGFYLVAAVGTKAILLYVAAFLGIVGLSLAPLYSAPLAVVLAAGCVFAYGPVGNGLGRKIFATDEHGWVDLPLHEKQQEGWVYAAESQYSFVKVEAEESEGTRELVLDFLIHAYLPKKITNLEYDYEDIYAAVTHRSFSRRDDLRALFLGGGGFIFPRYLRVFYPDSWLEVAEIDPGVTRANLVAFGLLPEEVEIVGDPGFLKGLPPAVPMTSAEDPAVKDDEDTGSNGSGGAEEKEEETGKARRAAKKPSDRKPVHRIQVYHLDARQHVEDLVRRKRSGVPFEPFDVIYGDAFNHYSVPFHLVTYEFNEKLKEILRPQTGLYMINVIDIYHHGLFIGAILNTLRETFPHVYILPNNEGGPDEREDGRDTFIAIGAFRELDMDDLGDELGGKEIKASMLEPEHLKTLEERSRRIVLRDDYSPVENLLEPVIRASR